MLHLSCFHGSTYLLELSKRYYLNMICKLNVIFIPYSNVSYFCNNYCCGNSIVDLVWVVKCGWFRVPKDTGQTTGVVWLAYVAIRSLEDNGRHIWAIWLGRFSHTPTIFAITEWSWKHWYVCSFEAWVHSCGLLELRCLTLCGLAQ
jgi:hypothetical protein